MRHLSARNAACALTCAIILPAFFSCKPNQEAYKAAYETAMAKQRAEAEADTLGLGNSTIYTSVRDQAIRSSLPLGADTLQVVTEVVSVSEGIPANELGRYSVIAGRFKQIFNAREMNKRLHDLGYNDAFIIETMEPLYYNAVSTTDMAATALEELRRVEADTARLRLRAPLPFVLESARNKR